MTNIQPLYKGGDPSFPLSPKPYYSRIEDKNVDFDATAIHEYGNNQFVAFRPGFSLQASELNEMQENFQLQMSLTISMMHNWITSGAGHLWMPWKSNSLGGEGGAWDGELPNSTTETGIGIGGIPDGGHNQELVVSGPGWRGATPLHPYYSPYQGGGNSKSVQYISHTSSSVRLAFNPGWWLVENKGHWNGDDDNTPMPTNISGLKHWIYLKNQIVKDVPTDGNTRYIAVGLNLVTDITECGTGTNQDEDLADNATGIPNSASCGASRYTINFHGDIFGSDNEDSAHYVEIPASPSSGEAWSLNNPDFAIRENMNPVCVVDTGSASSSMLSQIRYMNNLLIHKV
tara:strand:+ start:6664 stop:7695 length:1032 start_codon:yes stop_codon:yes gene_type:complete